MIYDINGNVLDSAYSVSEMVDNAYDINGSVVFQRTGYIVETLFRYPISASQGFAIYNGTIAQVRESVSLNIIDIETQTKVKDVSMDMGHGNSCQFSDEFYDPADEFPLFYIRNDGVWVYRIVGTSSTLVKKYSFPSDQLGTLNESYVAGFGVDSANRLLYTASYTQGNYISKTGLLRVCKWDMDDIIDNGDGTYTMRLIEYNDLTWFDKYEAVQGCCYKDGCFYISTGYDFTQQYVVFVDASSLSIISDILIDSTAEVEGCAWYGEYLIVGQRVNTYTYKKVIFFS